MDTIHRPIGEPTFDRSDQDPATRACSGSAGEREIAAQQRDLAAHARDRSADVRDREAQARDELSDRLNDIAGRARATSGRDVIVRAGLDRQRAGADRAFAAGHRALAAEDRERAAADRLWSERDRAAAVAEQSRADADDLVGVLPHRLGLAVLRREVDRAQRTGGVLTAVVVDVHLDEAVEDTKTCRAGDALPLGVGGAVLINLRSYDLLIGCGGDRFVCALCDLTITGARARFDVVQQILAGSGIAIRVGYAELAAGDTPATLVSRADSDLATTHVRRP